MQLQSLKPKDKQKKSGHWTNWQQTVLKEQFDILVTMCCWELEEIIDIKLTSVCSWVNYTAGVLCWGPLRPEPLYKSQLVS